MNFIAEISVMPLKELLDPQGKAIEQGLRKLDFREIDNVRIGKHIHLNISADSKEKAHAKVEEACKRLLANPIMEAYSFALKEV